MRGGGSSGGISGSGWRDRTLLESSLLGTSSGICGEITGRKIIRWISDAREMRDEQLIEIKDMIWITSAIVNVS